MTLNRSLHTQTHRTAPRTPPPPHPPPPHPTAPPRWERVQEFILFHAAVPNVSARFVD